MKSINRRMEIKRIKRCLNPLFSDSKSGWMARSKQILPRLQGDVMKIVLFGGYLDCAGKVPEIS